jgi:hypothetical protein
MFMHQKMYEYARKMFIIVFYLFIMILIGTLYIYMDIIV